MSIVAKRFTGMINPECVLDAVDGGSRETVLRELGSFLVERGFCLPSFVEAILERERIHPSGLAMPGHNFAIPHTDTVHVRRSVFLFARLATPVTFHMMGNPEAILDVRFVTMIALTEKDLTGATLVTLISVFQRREFFDAVMDAPDARRMYRVLIDAFQKEGM